MEPDCDNSITLPNTEYDEDTSIKTQSECYFDE